MKRGNFGSEGFTLIEVMIAVVVALIAIFGIMSAIFTVQRNTEATFERSLAVQDANQVIEQMRDAASKAIPDELYSDVSAAANEAIDGDGVDDVESLSADRNEQITVNYADITANPLDVTVTVTWNEQGLRPVSASVRTLIAKRRG